MKHIKQMIAVVTLVSFSSNVRADTIWVWSWNNEAGQFVTDGNLVGGVALPGTYDILDFSVDQTANGMPIGSLSGGEYTETQPTQGFMWDGSMATQWFRSSGTFTNGSNFFTADFAFKYLFFPGSYVIEETASSALVDSSSTLDFTVAAGLPGDYNGNNVIDAADYTAWRDALTAGATSLANDPTPGTVDESDFLYWRAHFGETLGSGAGSAAPVPEPSTLAILLMGTLTILYRRAPQFHVSARPAHGHSGCVDGDLCVSRARRRRRCSRFLAALSRDSSKR